MVLDMWMRVNLDIAPNIVINDPKGELLVKKYVTACMRGFTPNRIDALHPLATDIYNPVWDATQYARDKDIVNASTLIKNIGLTFFPNTGGGERLWVDGPKLAFQRMIYILMYEAMKNERILLHSKVLAGKSAALSTDEIDEVYKYVTLLDVYETFNSLCNTFVANPKRVLDADKKYTQYLDDKGQWKEDTPQSVKSEYAAKSQLLEPLVALFNNFEDPNKVSAMDIYCAAIKQFPKTGILSEVINAHDALYAMAKADRTIASIYGIAISQLNFFANPAVAALTSGKPSQNINIASFAFPRRIAVRFDPTFCRRNHYIGKLTRWAAYEDLECTKALGKDYEHLDMINMACWTNFYFKGYVKDVIYVKMDVLSDSDKSIIDTYYFKFKKGYKKNYNNKKYLLNPVTGKKIPYDGVVSEYTLIDTGDKQIASASTRVFLFTRNPAEERPRISSLQAKYQEGQNILWLISPPNLEEYNRLILILIKQMVDSNFGLAYLTKDNQKPMYSTMYMLDEVGNLQSDGQGIQGLGTDLSIGLGQGQHFTLVLQTLAQFTSLYGDDVEPILQSNAASLVFLKSNDDQMLQRLERLSGSVHRLHKTGGSVSEDRSRVLLRGEANVSYNFSFEEEPCVSYNDMRELPERNAVVFNAGQPVIWARNETALPMAWKMLQNSISDKEKYSLKTIPNLSGVRHVDYNDRNFDYKGFVNDTLTRFLYLSEAEEKVSVLFANNSSMKFDSSARADAIDAYLDELMTRPTTLYFDIDDSTLRKNDVPTEADAVANGIEFTGKKTEVDKTVNYPPTNAKVLDDSVSIPLNWFVNPTTETKQNLINAICKHWSSFANAKTGRKEDIIISKPSRKTKKIDVFACLAPDSDDYKKVISIDLTANGGIPDEDILKLVKYLRSGDSLEDALTNIYASTPDIVDEYMAGIAIASKIAGKSLNKYIKSYGHFFFCTKGGELDFIHYFMGISRK